MGEVLQFEGETTLDIPPDRILSGAIESKLESVIVIGENANGFYFASSTADIPSILFSIEMFKRDLLERT